MKKTIIIILLILPSLCLAQNWSSRVGNGGNTSRNGQVENVLFTLTTDDILWEDSEIYSFWPHQPFTEGDVVVTDRTFNMNDVFHGTLIVAYDITNGDTLWTADLPVDFPAKDTYTVSWNGKDFSGESVSSGIYYCKLIAGERASTHKLILIR